MPALLLRWTTPPVILAAAVGFALHNGLQYGRSNHCQYLLHGLNAADPTFLQNDWFTTQTPAHHGAFNVLVAFLARHTRLNVALGLLSAAAAVAFVLALYWIVAALCDDPLIPFSAVIVLAAHMGTDGPGHSNILLPYFVPSVFSGVMLLVAIACLLHRRDVMAGLTAAIGCALHANYLVLVGPLWVLVLLFDRRGGWRRAAALLVPWLLAWIPHVGMFLRVTSSPTPVEEARFIFWDIYAPLHYRPATWPARQYMDFLIVLAAGLLAARLVVLQPRDRSASSTARAVFLALVTIVAVGACCTMIWSIDVVTAIYPWRLAPFITLGAFVCMGLALAPNIVVRASSLHKPAMVVRASSLHKPTIVTRASILPPVILGFLLTAAIFATRMGQQVAVLFGIIAIGAILSRLITKTDASQTRRTIARFVSMALLVVVGASLARVGLWRRDRFGASYKPPVEKLFAWCREHTPPGTIFAIPPDLAGFRLETGRAVIVDWKCMPLTPDDQVEWLRRHERQAGGAVRCEADAIDGYSKIDTSRAGLLRGEFGCDYLLVERRRHRGDLAALSIVYENDWYAVINAERRRGAS